MKRFLYLILIPFCFCVLISDNSFPGSSQEEGSLVGGNAPQFEITGMSGKKIYLEKLLKEYKAVVLNFWGLRCGACIEEIPHLNAISKKFKDEIIILGVNVDGMDGNYIKGQMSSMGLVIDYEVVPDPEFAMADMYQMLAAPLTVIIDSKGVVRYWHENYEPGNEKELEEAIINTINGKTVVLH